MVENGVSMVSLAKLSTSVFCSKVIDRKLMSVSRRFCSIYNKDQEFRAWLVEERMLNPETMSEDQTKKEFARFVEDFNTGSSFTNSFNK